MNDGISIIIPTYNGGSIFSKCLERINQQDYSGKIQLIVVDSGSTDGTPELAQKAGAFVKRINKSEFHHARTRNKALSFAKFNKVVYTVQDAIPCSNTWLSDLERSLSEDGVAAVYTDQIPHDDADVFARFEIESISNGRGRQPVLQQLESHGSFQKMPYDEAYRAIGLDNVCAIYRKELLVNIPFPEVDFAEDLAWSLENMLIGYKIKYQPGIKIKHSHHRSPEYRFNRQVINSKFCAQIMNRVRDDMSFLTIRDLMTLTIGVRQFVNKLGSDILEESTMPDNKGKKSIQVIDNIVKKYSFRNRVRFFIDNFSRNSRPQSPELKMIEQQANQGVQHVMVTIKKNYKVTLKEELLEVLDQITASVLGRIYGEVYASCMLNGKMSSQLISFMRPFMKGV